MYQLSYDQKSFINDKNIKNVQGPMSSLNCFAVFFNFIQKT